MIILKKKIHIIGHSLIIVCIVFLCNFSNANENSAGEAVNSVQHETFIETQKTDVVIDNTSKNNENSTGEVVNSVQNETSIETQKADVVIDNKSKNNEEENNLKDNTKQLPIEQQNIDNVPKNETTNNTNNKTQINSDNISNEKMETSIKEEVKYQTKELSNLLENKNKEDGVDKKNNDIQTTNNNKTNKDVIENLSSQKNTDISNQIKVVPNEENATVKTLTQDTLKKLEQQVIKESEYQDKKEQQEINKILNERSQQIINEIKNEEIKELTLNNESAINTAEKEIKDSRSKEKQNKIEDKINTNTLFTVFSKQKVLDFEYDKISYNNFSLLENKEELQLIKDIINGVIKDNKQSDNNKNNKNTINNKNSTSLNGIDDYLTTNVENSLRISSLVYFNDKDWKAKINSEMINYKNKDKKTFHGVSVIKANKISMIFLIQQPNIKADLVRKIQEEKNSYSNNYYLVRDGKDIYVAFKLFIGQKINLDTMKITG